eukprot:gene918-5219_t
MELPHGYADMVKRSSQTGSPQEEGFPGGGKDGEKGGPAGEELVDDAAEAQAMLKLAAFSAAEVIEGRGDTSGALVAVGAATDPMGTTGLIGAIDATAQELEGELQSLDVRRHSILMGQLYQSPRPKSLDVQRHSILMGQLYPEPTPRGGDSGGSAASGADSNTLFSRGTVKFGGVPDSDEGEGDGDGGGSGSKSQGQSYPASRLGTAQSAYSSWGREGVYSSGSQLPDAGYVAARVERSKMISTQLITLKEESKRLQEHSQALQARAAQMQAEAGLPSLYGEYLSHPLATPPATQLPSISSPMAERGPLAEEVRQNEEGEAKPGKNPKYSAVKSKVAEGLLSSHPPKPVKASRDRGVSKAKEVDAGAHSDGGLLPKRGTRQPAGDSSSGGRKGALPPLSLSDGEAGASHGHSSSAQPLAGTTWRPKKSIPLPSPSRKPQPSSYSDLARGKTVAPPKGDADSLRPNSSSSAVCDSPALPSWEDQLNSLSPSSASNAGWGFSPQKKKSSSQPGSGPAADGYAIPGSCVSAPAGSITTPPRSLSWNERAASEQLQRMHQGGYQSPLMLEDETGRRKFLPTLKLPPTLAAMMAEREAAQAEKEARKQRLFQEHLGAARGESRSRERGTSSASPHQAQGPQHAQGLQPVQRSQPAHHLPPQAPSMAWNGMGRAMGSGSGSDPTHSESARGGGSNQMRNRLQEQQNQLARQRQKDNAGGWRSDTSAGVTYPPPMAHGTLGGGGGGAYGSTLGAGMGMNQRLSAGGNGGYTAATMYTRGGAGPVHNGRGAMYGGMQRNGLSTVPMMGSGIGSGMGSGLGAGIRSGFGGMGMGSGYGGSYNLGSAHAVGYDAGAAGFMGGGGGAGTSSYGVDMVEDQQAMWGGGGGAGGASGYGSGYGGGYSGGAAGYGSGYNAGAPAYSAGVQHRR